VSGNGEVTRQELLEGAGLQYLTKPEKPSYDGYEAITLEFDNQIAVITLSATLSECEPELTRYFFEVAADPDVRATVIKGVDGERTFSRGGNIKMMKARAALIHDRAPELPWPERMPYRRAAERLLDAFLGCEHPIIAAINGHAAGGGAHISMLCDLRIIAEDVKFGDPHVKVGLSAGVGSILTALLVGPMRAKRFALTGDLVTGREAAEIGLCDKAVPMEEVVPEAMAQARRLIELPPLAVAWTKRTLNDMIRAQLVTHGGGAGAFEGLTMLTDDHLEAASAFVDKRPGSYVGR
jgi:enoyl-CoA hydratase